MTVESPIKSAAEASGLPSAYATRSVTEASAFLREQLLAVVRQHMPEIEAVVRDSKAGAGLAPRQMARALQAVKEPDQLLLDMVRVGKEVIVTFPNFAHWQNRIHLGIKGMMPMSEALPFAWYNTPNIHLCTFKDFEKLCDDNDIRIINRFAVQESEKPYPWALAQIIRKNPNLLADVAIYRVTKN